ncbi:SusC/RagA family TonB-linked outer membrane protein [Chitinophaga nivalis]|uniref:SusC/RagA family TonB-linked outer membrane protein n=1 Tax=Chitinophaga nivalis TaxID=2991709 RepID=A0ABT3IQL2_9BACT|nr:SusC/RagA family TonB-linked outer membrane protein [Chitinophaga nivalis]MCW3464056.1 SusC/RagA family TonB-linked outer membrane protein [Chitinophaga nivalis]MCW3486254.1 SusC/RagA family TonB-linked outer membrane protein [Chitinophaga nivalis]
MCKKWLLLALMGFLCLQVWAQERKISGTVKDEKGGALPGVSVKEAGTNNGAATTPDGKFTLTLKGTSYKLSVSFIGYETQTIAITDRDNYQISMKADAKSLKDVVVIGYQEVKRKTVTAAVASVKGKEIENLPSPSFDQLLQGRAAGLNVQNFTGEPGVRGSFVIRGNTSISRSADNARALSSPLFVIDGIPVSMDDAAAFDNTGTNYIAGLNPNDIESIDILKDASAAAIYGSRGANGVVIIKTRRGKPGKPQVNFSTYAGMVKKPKFEKVFGGAEERRFKMDYLQQHLHPELLGKVLPMILTDSLNPAFNGAVDWQDLFYRNGTLQNYDLSVSGASDLMNYRISGNYYNEDGSIKGTGFKRYTISAAMGVKMSSRLSVDALFRLSRGDRSRGRGQFPGEDAIPLQNGQYLSSLLNITDIDRKNFTGDLSSGRDKNINDDITASLTVNYDINSKLRFSSVGSIQSSVNSRDIFRPGALNIAGLSYAQSNKSRYENLNLDNTLNYTTNIFNKEHHLNVLLGNTINNVKNEYTGIGSGALGNDNVKVVQGYNVNYLLREDVYGNLVSGSNYSSAGMLSFFSRINYDYKERYLLSFAYRADASSRFGRNSRWGYFPSVSVGWNVSDEPFMEPVKKWMDMLKFRGSYGVTGSLPGGFYLPYNTYSINQGTYGGSTGGTYNGVNAVTPNFADGVAQDGLTWEQSIQSNIGFDASFFNGRLNATVDAYNRGKSKTLFDLLLPATSGYDKVNTNAVGLRNTGIEFTIQGRIFAPNKPFQWNSRLILSFNRNQITELPNGNRDLVVSNDNLGITYILTKGRPINEFYMIKSNGVYGSDQDIPFNPYTGEKLTYWNGNHTVQPGDFIWVDQNGDFDVWDWNDKVRGGNPNPSVTGGFTNTFSYKGVSLEVFVTFLLGRDIYNKYMSDRLKGLRNDFGSIAGIDPSKVDTWRKPGDQNKYSELIPYAPGYYYQFLPFSTAFVESGNYARIKYLNLSYTFNRKFLDKIKLRNLQIYGVMDNVAMFQQTSVPDAEAVDERGTYTGGGYPIPKKFTLGVNVGF